MKKQQSKLLLRASIALLLVVVTLLTAACGGRGGKIPVSTTTPETEANGPSVGVNPLDTVEVRNFDRDIMVLSAGYTNGWMTQGVDYENTVAGEPIAEVVYKRTLAFEEKYNTTVFSTGTDSNSVYKALEASVRMNAADYDLVLPHPTDGLATMMLSGWFTDLNTVKTIDLTGAWYNQSQIENYTSNNKLYIATSDIIVQGQSFIALVYNRALMSKYSFETDVKTLVEEKKWTMEALNEMLTLTESSSTGDENGQVYGLAFNYASIGRWMYAMGETILQRGTDGSFTAGCKNTKMLSIARALDKLLNSHGEAVILSKAYSGQLAASDVWKAFSAGNALFLTWDIGGCYNYLRELTFNVGYAPLPMLDDKQNDYYINCAAGLFAIPKTAHSLEESGLMFEFMSRYSYVNLRPIFFETILGGRLSEFPEDYAMLEFLHNHKSWDFGYTLDEKSTYLDALIVPVVDNKAPDGISILLSGKRTVMNEIVRSANEIQ